MPHNGDHFYTADLDELRRSTGAEAGGYSGYDYETIACYLYPYPLPGTVGLLRLYSSTLVDHLYTTSLEELQQSVAGGDYEFEKMAGWILTEPAAGAVPLYRLYGPKHEDHFYTTDLREANRVIETAGYVPEGAIGYVFEQPVAESVPLYRLYQPNLADPEAREQPKPPEAYGPYRDEC